MRLAYCFPEALPSKTARSVQAVGTCASLAEEVNELILYLPRGKFDGQAIFQYYGLEKPPNVSVSFLRKSIGPLSSHNLYNRNLSIALKKDRPDIFLSRHLPTAASLLKKPTPVIYEAHEIFAEKQNASKKDRLRETAVMENVQGTIFISQGLQRAMENMYKISGRRKIVPCSARRIPSWADRHCEHGRIDRFVYVGTSRYPWKGIDTLIEALSLLPEQCVLEIVGDLDERFCRRPEVMSLMESGRLVIRGHLPFSEIFLVLKEAQVAVVPNSARDRISAFFTSPLKLVEALAAGVAVVVSDLPSMREVVSEKEALFVSPDDPVSLANGIQKLLQDGSLRNRLAQNGWKRSCSFSWQNRARKIVELAQQILYDSSV